MLPPLLGPSSARQGVGEAVRLRRGWVLAHLLQLLCWELVVLGALVPDSERLFSNKAQERRTGGSR